MLHTRTACGCWAEPLPPWDAYLAQHTRLFNVQSATYVCCAPSPICAMQAIPTPSGLLGHASSGVRTLAYFPKLRSLKWVGAQLLDLQIWQSLARLSALQSLEVSVVDGHRLAHAVEIAGCSSLTRLHISETFVERPPSWNRQLNLLLVNKVGSCWKFSF